MRNGSALTTTVVHAIGSRPVTSTCDTALSSTSIASTCAPTSIRAPARRAASAMRAVRVPIPPSTSIQVPSEPGSRHMLWARKLKPVPGVSHVPSPPATPSVTAYIALTRSLLNSKRSRYAPTEPRHRFTNASRSAGRT